MEEHSMRDISRIHKLIGLLTSYWLQHQDIRFFQLVEHLKSVVNFHNGQQCDHDLFYAEDELLIESLKKLLKE